MKIEELIGIINERGFTISVKDGKPVISGDRTRATPALMDAIKAHRNDILIYFGLGHPPIKPPQPNGVVDTECLWPGNDYVSPHWFPEVGWPVGAYFYRRIGDTEWLAIPGRTWDKTCKRGTIEKRKK